VTDDPSQPISVLINSARVDAHLDAAIESIRAQGDVDFELVLVLDGTPVPTSGHAWMDDPRVRILELPTRLGTPAALNRGVAAARHELIAHLDGDDLASAGRLRAQLDEMSRRPDLVCLGTGVTLIDHEDRLLGELRPLTGHRQVAQALTRRNVVTHSSMMYRRSALQQIGGYDERCARMQDYDLLLRLARIGAIDNLPDLLTSYRVHNAQASRSTSPYRRYTRIILRQRTQLARFLGRGRLAQRCADAVWLAAQVARFHGLTRPGHVRRAESTRGSATGRARR
jgi:GT2 family glycosyltransferase